MIDTHCHLLPNLDDGPADLGESVAMAGLAASEGIDTIIATPHHKNSHFSNPKANILEGTRLLNDRLEAEGIRVTVIPGQEVFLYRDMIRDHEHGHLLEINQNSGYIYVELPSGAIPRATETLLFELQVHGLTPIITQPELNKTFYQHPNLLYEWIRNGTLAQVSTQSLVGKHGKKVRKFAAEILDAGLAHLIGSDAKRQSESSFCMKEAHQIIKRQNSERTLNILNENASALIDGQMLEVEQPKRFKKRKLFDLF